MSADRLREAAKVLRERAEAATPGPWEVAREAASSTLSALIRRSSNSPRMCWPSHVSVDAQYWEDEAQHNNGDAAYIATMHPGVGLALADWLDDIAAGWMWDDEGNGGHWDDGTPMHLSEAVDSRALRLADLILGGA